MCVGIFDVLALQSSPPPGLWEKLLGAQKSVLEWYGVVMGTTATGVRGLRQRGGRTFCNKKLMLENPAQRSTEEAA